jgi:hypothetical protein
VVTLAEKGTAMLKIAAFSGVLITTVLAAGVASAHPHRALNGQVLANGQNHAAFTLVPGEDDRDPVFRIQSCGGDPAAFGLETQHHGRDLSPGRRDGCYETWGMINPAWLAAKTGPKYIPVS